MFPLNNSGFYKVQAGGLPYTPPLDGNNATYAGGFRKLRTDYDGFCCQIEWLPSNTTYDIGFKSNGLIDEAEILSVKGLDTTCQVRILYNQTGNLGFYIQVLRAFQPIIYKDGDFIRNSSGKLAMNTDETNIRYFVGDENALEFGRNCGHINYYVYGKITQAKVTGANQALWSITLSNQLAQNEIITNLTSPGKINYGGRRVVGNSFQSIVSTNQWPDSDFLFSGNTEYENAYIQMYFNNVFEASSATFQTSGNTEDFPSHSTSLISRLSGAQLACKGVFSEFILWTNDQSANYASIRNNIIDYYA